MRVTGNSKWEVRACGNLYKVYIGAYRILRFRACRFEVVLGLSVLRLRV